MTSYTREELLKDWGHALDRAFAPSATCPDRWDAEWDKMPHTPDEYRREIRELRERCAAYAAALMEPDALTQTVKAEREACAQLCDYAATECEYGGDGWYAAKTLAAAIRARG